MRLSRYWMTGCMALVLMGVSPVMRAKESERGDRGWISVVSKHSPQDTLRLLEREARAQGLSVFAKLPLHAAGAERDAAMAVEGAPASMAQVLILGSEPHLTPVVQGESSDIQLPLELIVSGRADGTTEVLLKDVSALTQGQEVPPEWAHSVAGLSEVVGRALA